jgi:metal-responsive CopG/Arc/MetJ family transcriptional regulator
MTLEASLVREVDRVAKRLGTTRSAFTRRALRETLSRLEVAEQEARHRRGYSSKPVRRGEFDGWESEQAWPEE